jgi:hypothetical protein
VCKYQELRKFVYPANAENLAKNGIFTMEPEILVGIFDGKPALIAIGLYFEENIF